MSGGECTMPSCDRPVADDRATGGLCEHHLTGSESGGNGDTVEISDADIAEHYTDIGSTIQSVSELESGAQSLGNHDFIGWYRTRGETKPSVIQQGYDRRGSAFRLGDDYTELRGKLDRVLYATINYQPRDALGWQPFAHGENGKDWKDDEKPTPGYGDLSAIAPFADIDLSDEHKERPLPEETRETVERALSQYIEEFAELAGGRESVFALDSVGGAYLFVAPASTAPIAEHFDGNAKRLLFKELVSRTNSWLDAAKARVNEKVPAAEGVFEPDLLNNANRLYKAPLSLHSSIDGVVHPLDATADTPEYEFVSFDDADGKLAEETREWGEAFTDDAHADRIGALVETLWSDYADDTDSWQDALTAWLADERARVREKEIQREAIEQRRAERDVDLGDMETTEHHGDIHDAIQDIDVRDVARDVATEWDTDPGRDPPRFAAPWHSEHKSGTSCFAHRDGFTDIKEGANGGDALTLVARARNIITDCGQRVTGEDFWDALDELRKLGYDIPEFEGGSEGGPVSALPLKQLDALAPQERRRAAKKRGLEWPSTDDARERLFQRVTKVMANEDDRVIDAPTSLGKSHTIAATPWDSPQYESTTGDRPVVHLSKTRDARSESVRTAKQDGAGCFTLLGRTEACPVAAGEFDPEQCEGSDDQPVTVDGTPASIWLETQCDHKGMPFSVAHTRLKNQKDQDGDLPCSADGERCRAIVQWEDLREEDHTLIEATHNFAHVPGLRMRTNVVFDEEPDFTEDMDTDRVRRMITALLKELDAPVTTWEAFIGLCRLRGGGSDAGREADELAHALDDAEPDRDWYFEEPHAHTLAPAIARAIFYAEDRGNGRWGSTTSHDPPRLDANAADDDGWNREWVRVVLDEDNEVRTVRCSPDLNLCRSVIGLDAHPSMPIWQVNTLPHIGKKEVLGTNERQLWRRYERGLRVVQVGDATRPLTTGEWFNSGGKFSTLLEHLHGEYGSDFRTAITASSVEDETKELMREVGISDPETMHYGEEKSRNDFADEPVGLVNGSIDPGDDFVVNLLAELDLDAEPETDVDDDGDEYRAHGRGFVGDDADTAAEILASVRENHVAQSAGRYARDPDDPETNATVFVRTDAVPVGFADVEVPGVEWVFSDQQRKVVEDLRGRERPTTAKDIARTTGVSKRHAQRTLKRLADESSVQCFEGEGDWGADLYVESGLPNSGVVSTDDGDSGFSGRTTYGDSSTWSVSILSPLPSSPPPKASDGSEQRQRSGWWVDDGSESGGTAPGGDAT